MPYPKNLQTAMEVEAIVRENGAVPATIAILDGVPHVGLNSEQLKRLAISGTQFQKTARRDIVQLVASGGNGATTVSATMFFAHKVGIPIFVTGGSEACTDTVKRVSSFQLCKEFLFRLQTAAHNLTRFPFCAAMDISSDLTELGKTPVAVISAGVKSILDISRTLELYLTFSEFDIEVLMEQLSKLQALSVKFCSNFVAELMWAQNDKCTSLDKLEKSGSEIAPCRVDSPEECAKIIDANKKMHLGSGILIAVPIPKQHSASGNIIESAIQQALKEAEYTLPAPCYLSLYVTQSPIETSPNDSALCFPVIKR
ncbi:hypothetical protein ACQ4PT_004070 [Festuca glaucescens]